MVDVKQKHIALNGVKKGQWVNCTAKGVCRSGGQHVTVETFTAASAWLTSIGKPKPNYKITKLDVNKYLKTVQAPTVVAQVKEPKKAVKVPLVVEPIFNLGLTKNIEATNLILDETLMKRIKSKARAFKVKLEFKDMVETVIKGATIFEVPVLKASGEPQKVYDFEDWLIEERKNELFKSFLTILDMDLGVFSELVVEATAKNILTVVENLTITKKYKFFGKAIVNADQMKLYGNKQDVQKFLNVALIKTFS